MRRAVWDIVVSGHKPCIPSDFFAFDWSPFSLLDLISLYSLSIASNLSSIAPSPTFTTFRSLSEAVNNPNNGPTGAIALTGFSSPLFSKENGQTILSSL